MLEAVLTGWNGPGRARTVANRAETALTDAVRSVLQSSEMATGYSIPNQFICR